MRELFAPDTVLEINIEMDRSDWLALRRQGPDVRCRPGVEFEFTGFPARVELNGHRERVRVKKKSVCGSLSSAKPSLNLLDLDLRDDEGNRVKKLVLNNSVQDPHYVRQCVAYSALADWGVPAPRCNFALVRVNDQAVGLYVHVEAVDEGLLARHFSSSEGPLLEGDFTGNRHFLAPATSQLLPGVPRTSTRTLPSDFYSQATLDRLAVAENGLVVDAAQGGAEIRPQDLFELKQGDAGEIEAFFASEDYRELVAVLDADPAMVTDQQLELIARLFDLDALTDAYVAEHLLGHGDGFSANRNNYYLYRNPDNGKFYVIAWGADQVLNRAWERPRPFRSWKLARVLLAHEGVRGQIIGKFDRLRAILPAQVLIDRTAASLAVVGEHVAVDAEAALGEVRDVLSRTYAGNGSEVFVRQE